MSVCNRCRESTPLMENYRRGQLVAKTQGRKNSSSLQLVGAFNWPWLHRSNSVSDDQKEKK